MAITIKDLAKIAGVSHTTVSRALNDSPLLKDITKERIQRLAQEQGYQPNYTAKALKLNKSFTYGLFFSTLDEASTNNFVFEAIKGVKNNLPKGYRLTVESIDDVLDYDTITLKNYDGIMVVSQRYEDEAFVSKVSDSGIPVVVLNRLVESQTMSCIAYDDEQGISNAVMYLAKEGHRAIAYIGGKKGFYNADRRYQGYVQGLKSVSIDYNQNLVAYGDFTIKSGYIGCEQLLARDDFTALICANDEMAIGAMKALRISGIVVGKDISIVGFDDNDSNAYLEPPLASIRRSVFKMAQEGIKELNQLVSGSKQDHCQKLLKTKLVVRASIFRNKM